MNKIRRIGFLCLLLIGCNSDDDMNACEDTFAINQSPCQEFTNITPPCIIEQAVELVGGKELTKYVYHHDGSNYDKIEVYYRNDAETDYPALPRETVTMIYEGNKIKEVTVQPSNNSSTLRKYTYSYSDLAVSETFQLLISGVVISTDTYEQLYVTEPKDSTYVIESIDRDMLREYKSGNNVRVAIESSEGACVINDQRWVFTSKMIHDVNPNVFEDYAVRFPLGGETGFAGQFWFANNKNNIVASADPRDVTQNILSCYNFLKNGELLWIKEYEGYYNITYTYSCE